MTEQFPCDLLVNFRSALVRGDLLIHLHYLPMTRVFCIGAVVKKVPILQQEPHCSMLIMVYRHNPICFVQFKFHISGISIAKWLIYSWRTHSICSLSKSDHLLHHFLHSTMVFVDGDYS